VIAAFIIISHFSPSFIVLNLIPLIPISFLHWYTENRPLSIDELSSSVFNRSLARFVKLVSEDTYGLSGILNGKGSSSVGLIILQSFGRDCSSNIKSSKTICVDEQEINSVKIMAELADVLKFIVLSHFLSVVYDHVYNCTKDPVEKQELDSLSLREWNFEYYLP
jgi:hypothetical protein